MIKDGLIGYSALRLFDECYEYNENACYVADSDQSLKKFLKEAMLPFDEYKTTPMKFSDILNDEGGSSGEYALEEKALERFKKLTKENNVKYQMEQFMDQMEQFMDSPPPPLYIINIINID